MDLINKLIPTKIQTVIKVFLISIFPFNFDRWAPKNPPAKEPIIKIINKPGNKVVDGYGREIQLKKAEIDHDKIDELWMSDPDFMADIEGSN